MEKQRCLIICSRLILPIKVVGPLQSIVFQFEVETLVFFIHSMPYFHYEFVVFVGCSKCKQSLLDFAKNRSLAEKQKGFIPRQWFC
jgi:hypothetical protein